MSSKFEISTLPRATKVLSSDRFITEHGVSSYSIGFDDIAMAVLSDHLSVSVSRDDKTGSNTLSISHVSFDGSLTNIFATRLQDGILSAAYYDPDARTLWLKFNTAQQAISVDLSRLVDTYSAAGNGIELSGTTFGLDYPSISANLGLSSYMKNDRLSVMRLDDYLVAESVLSATDVFFFTYED